MRCAVLPHFPWIMTSTSGHTALQGKVMRPSNFLSHFFQWGAWGPQGFHSSFFGLEPQICWHSDHYSSNCMLPEASFSSFLCHIIANIFKWLPWSNNLLSGGSMKLDRTVPNYKKTHKILKWTYRSNLSVKKNAISHLNSIPIMELNYDDHLF